MRRVQLGAPITDFGQRKPIVVRRSDNVVIAGNHTMQAAQALGWSEIAVVWVDDDEVTMTTTVAHQWQSFKIRE